MAEIINLRRARKAQKRKAEAEIAVTNRAHFGQSAASRAAQEALEARQQRLWQGHKRELKPDET